MQVAEQKVAVAKSTPQADMQSVHVAIIITHAGIATGVGRAFSHVCLSACLHSKRKTARAIAQLLVIRAAVARMGLHVDTTACFLVLKMKSN